jgi:spiro-SPASM protein
MSRTHSLSSIAIYLDKQIYLKDDLVKLFFTKLRNTFPDVVCYSNFQIPNESLELVSANSEITFLREVSKKLPKSSFEDEDIDEVFFAYFDGIYPALSHKHTQILLQRHIQYLSQYSYSENFPNGILPKFISREFVNSIPLEWNLSPHEFLLKNLNQFDVEIYFKEPDLRQYRLDFSLKDYRSLELTESLLKINPDIELEDILPILQKNPSLFRTSPSYLEIEIFRGCENTCTFCPRQYKKLENDFTAMDKSLLEKLLSEVDSNHVYTVCFGGLGEPLLHPELKSIIEFTISQKHVQELIIETSLYTEIDSLLSIDSENLNKLTIIVNLTTLNQKTFEGIYSKSNVKDILEKIEKLILKLGKQQVHVQMLKIKEIENEIEDYFSFFKEKEINVILQKYNRFFIMPEKRVSDLTPIHRNFCWHLARDFYINSSGDVSLCRQKETIIGNLKQENFSKIWNKAEKDFYYSMNGEHSRLNVDCLNCDEWYTFHA